VHGGDGLGDAAALPGAGPGAAGRPAHEHMVELIRAQPGAISVLALGPLTNLALALRHDPGQIDAERWIALVAEKLDDRAAAAASRERVASAYAMIPFRPKDAPFGPADFARKQGLAAI